MCVYVCLHPIMAVLSGPQGYKMDDLLTSYISQMLTTMSKQRTSRGQSKWTSYWQEAAELLRLLRPMGHPCSWGRTFPSHVWRMSRSPSHSSAGGSSFSQDPPDDDASSSPSSEDDYLWGSGSSHLAVPCSPTPTLPPLHPPDALTDSIRWYVNLFLNTADTNPPDSLSNWNGHIRMWCSCH